MERTVGYENEDSLRNSKYLSSIPVSGSVFFLGCAEFAYFLLLTILIDMQRIVRNENEDRAVIQAG